MKIDIQGTKKCAFLNGILFNIWNYSDFGWGYYTPNAELAESLGFKKEDCFNESKTYFLPIKDIAHTRGFYSYVGCKYKGYKCFVHSYGKNEKKFCVAIPEDLALTMGIDGYRWGHETPSMDVPLSDLDEIYRCREKLDDFIFDVDPIKPIYKDGKWLIEPDENGVYVI
ncbi:MULTISPECIES: hypothetical protein [unclassified Bacteroides]|uniref:hypothetical protein n=1 Tax=unclassified Bacteroides TaxID=2646097 RepID=UPI0004E22A50|nr:MULTISPECIES: hypothetical protein [unclassified Bacteroides]